MAAVGFVESAHGTHGGGSLTAAGQASRPIVGPSLNGDGFAAIPDTDDGVLDGDAHWDHAVGPMQFIPSTWQMAGRDGNGDGQSDPLNIDDAALSAASYLCGGGRDLTTARGWTDAVYSYNQSDSYVDQVREQATTTPHSQARSDNFSVCPYASVRERHQTEKNDGGRSRRRYQATRSAVRAPVLPSLARWAHILSTIDPMPPSEVRHRPASSASSGSRVSSCEARRDAGMKCPGRWVRRSRSTAGSDVQQDESG